jgi:CHAT domain-containing protein
LIVTQSLTEPLLIVLPHGDQMEGREFIHYKNSIQFATEDRRAYSFFWLPLNAALKDIHTIYFSPDGVYNKMNLGTLYDPSSNEFLIDRLNIHLVSNTKEILNKTESLPAVAVAALIGFPDYNLENANETDAPIAQLRDFNLLNQSDIPELPGTKEELLKINELLINQKWQVNLYMRAHATEESVKKLNSPTVLHIATHGFFIESKNDNAPVIFSRDLSKKENNPLLRSGLILAGAENSHQAAANNEKEDGILTALEAMNLNLDKTNLVVLSACETGTGQIRNGEGVFGLQRSFLVSGASSIMMSLWKVNDNATQELMVEFYKNWLASGNKADAFRKTQLTLKKKYVSPYYWGSFIMMGK